MGRRVAVAAGDVWPAEADTEEAVVITWFAREGREVSAGERLCKVQVEKVDVDVHAPAAGTLAEIAREEDDGFERGDVLAQIEPG